ncbi:methyltransferase domain-containing protein [Arcobacter arenosus]|nr:methyltransferase domain-containing protein [Arcobacter arenosus]
MAQKDKEKWDKKYNETPRLMKDRTPSPKVVEAIQYTRGKKALEIACGTGRNSIFLAENRFEVEAFDISEVAINHLKKQNIKNLTAIQKDLENFDIEKNSFDLIVQTNYLDRKIFPNLKEALKKDGIIVIETYMNHKENEKPPSNPLFLLKENELKEIFSDFEIIKYDEYFNEKHELYKMRKQAIIAKKL